MKHRNPVAAILSILLLVTCCRFAAAQDPEWKTIRPGGEEFTVEMPAIPSKVGRVVPIENGVRLAVDAYDLVVNNIRLQIMSFNKSSKSTVPMLRDFKLFVEGFQRALVNGDDHRNNSIIAEKNATSSDQVPQQFQLRMDDYKGLLRLYDGKYHCYVVMIVGGVESDPLVSRFLSSFKLGGKMHTPQLPDKSIGTAAQPNVPPEPWSGQLPANMAPISFGVLNGKAIEFPAPKYPNEAGQVGASGRVTVQIVVDEQGRVISAKAIGGPDTLREAATNAAWKARFSQTRLMGQPVKITGVLVYNFVFGP